MSCICYCDAEAPEFYNAKDVVARKQHKCSECGEDIKAGETYEYLFGKWGGETTTYKTCSDCLNLRFALGTTPCYCLVHGSLLEDFSETINECWKFSYSMKGMIHRHKWVVDDIKETFEEWEEMRA